MKDKTTNADQQYNMKKDFRKDIKVSLLLFMVCIICVLMLNTTAQTSTKTAAPALVQNKIIKEKEIIRRQLQSKLKEQKKQALAFCKAYKMDTTVAILIDMKIHSGRNRLFVLDLKADTLMLKGLCSNGSCDGQTAPKTVQPGTGFSNQPSSYCTSLGKYKIGIRSWSNWGINVHYKLHGLDSTNNNAFRRVVVFHSYDGVPNEEVYPDHVMTSLGCPMVSDDNMRYLDKLLKKKKNVLMWIYN